MKPKSDLPYLEWTEPDTGAVVRLYADVITEESANLAAVVTQHAVEKGSKITDHYRKEPESIRVTYHFSGAPIRGDLDDDNPGTIGPTTLTYQRAPLDRTSRRPDVTPLKYPPGAGPGLALLNPFNAAAAGLSALGGVLGLGGLPQQVTPSALQESGKLPTSVQALTFGTNPAKRLDRAIKTIRRLQTLGILVTVKTTFGPFSDCGILVAEVKRSPDMGTSGEISFEFQQLRFVSSDIALALPIPLEPRALPAKGAGAAGAAPVDPKAGEASAAKKAATDWLGFFSAGSGQ